MKMLFFLPIKSEIDPKMSVASIAPKALFELIQEISSVVAGPFFKGVLSLCRIGIAGEVQPVSNP